MSPGYRSKQIILLIGDILCFCVGFIASLWLRNLQFPTRVDIARLDQMFVIIFLIWIVVLYIIGLYDVDRLPKEKTFYRRFTETAVISFVISIVFLYLFPTKDISPKTILGLNIIFGFGLSVLWRLVYERFILSEQRKIPLLFVGFTPEVRELLTLLGNNPQKGYQVIAIIDPLIEESAGQSIPAYKELKTVQTLTKKHSGSTLVLAPHIRQDATALSELYSLLFTPTRIMDMSSFYESVTGRVPPSTFSEGWFLDHLQNKEQPVYDKFRTLADYVIGIILTICFIILFPFIALAIRAGSQGPIIIKQKRVGKYGAVFSLYKFRSMYALAPDGSAEVAGVVFAQKDDKRVTPFGKFLRKTRLDEMPQALNLLKRDITLIGPRPERPEMVQKIEDQMPYYSIRHIVRPGMTGWAVLNQNYADTMETALEKLQYDLFYIKNRTFLLDLSILLRTVNIVVRMLGQ